MDDIREQEIYDIGTPPVVGAAQEPALWNPAADMPVWTWSQLEDALTELAASRQQHDMIESLVSATRKQARYLPSGHTLKEILCIAWVIADETFKGGRGEDSSMT
ncbi:MAG: hypothetical protein Q8L23_13355 [Caulobacter sp.]|nr:hypothetical protein [Caulobacter sp.]